jgi:hypothetical protein
MVFFIVVPDKQQKLKRTAGSGPAFRELHRFQWMQKTGCNSASSGAGRRPRGNCGASAHHFVRDGHEVALAHLLHLVGKSRHTPIAFGEFGVTRLIAEIAQAHPQRIAA